MDAFVMVAVDEDEDDVVVVVVVEVEDWRCVCGECGECIMRIEVSLLW